jgi:hypothetical protein
MKTIKKLIILIGILIKLLIDISFGLLVTIIVILVVYPFTFIYERCKQVYYEIKQL